jgi:hypothetical protein
LTNRSVVVHASSPEKAVLHHALTEQKKQDKNHGNGNKLQDSEPIRLGFRVVR